MFGGRYRVEDQPIGHGGMGVVYKAFDTVAKRYVALKTLKGEVDRTSLDLFQREWSVLAQLSHPNIVDVLDIGDYTEHGQQKPYFVMPLLPGCTLSALIASSGSRLTIERVVDMICQACRGLQAAHDRGLVHRDLKPTNLFVMSDDTVKIIDFGIVHLTDNESRTSMKGTLHYMAPEQLEMKPASARSDIYSLGVVCYEALTGRKPFERSTEEEVIEAIRTHMPLPVSDLNTAINDQVGRTVHKAMAKQPYHRFSSVREFAEVLQRAVRNEHIDMFDRSRIQPRMNRINRALNESDFQLAIDMLDELESEGNIDPEMPLLRVRAEQATKSRVIYQLIESARTRMEEQEYPLALQNVQRVLEIDRTNVDALALKTEIERQRGADQIGKWLQICRQHRDNKLYGKARQAVDEVLKIDHTNKAARELLDEITRGEQDLAKIRQDKQQLYDSALRAYRNGEISSALQKLEKVIDLGKSAPGNPNTDAQYMAFYEQVRGERDLLQEKYTEGKRAVAARNYAAALQICADVLTRRPADPLFKALKIEIEDLQRQENSAAVAQLHSQIESEADLDRKYALLKDAVKQFPDEQMFSQSLRVVKDRRDLVNTIVVRARHYESQGSFLEAANQWDILRNVYSQYPGLEFEVQRLSRKQELHVQEEAKAHWVESIDRALLSGDYGRAQELLRAALEEAPEDGELLGLQQQVSVSAERGDRAAALLEEGNHRASAGDQLGALQTLRAARELDSKNVSIVTALSLTLVAHARSLAEQDWRSAVPFIEEALDINPADPGAASVARLLEDMRRREHVEWFLLEARELQTQRKLTLALAKVEQGLREYPGDMRLSKLQSMLQEAIDAQHSESRRKADAAALEAERAAAAAAGIGNALAEPNTGAPLAATNIFHGRASVPANESKRKADDDTLIADRDPAPPSAPRGIPPQLYVVEESAGTLGRKFILAVAAIVIVVAALIIRTLGRKHSPTLIEPQPIAVAAKPGDPAIPVNSSPDASTRQLVTDKPLVSDPSARKTVAGFWLDFESSPSPASVVVDKAISCLTPCPLQLSRGQHKAVVSAPNYSPEQRIVEVPQDTKAFFSLHGELKSVLLESNPQGASVTVDGEPKGVTPVSVQLSLGQHRLTFRKDNMVAEEMEEITPETFGFTVPMTGEKPEEVSAPHKQQ